jgi:quercetin 2,3-dioxygenase
MAPRSDPLPDEKRAYFLAAGEGEHYVFGTQLATVIAPARSTGNLFELVVLSGGKGDAFPLHLHTRAHESIFVIAGKLELTLNGHTYLLTPGDYACIPAGTPHGYRMRSHRTRLLSFTTGGEVARLYSHVGEPCELREHPEQARNANFAARFTGAEAVADFKPVSPAANAERSAFVEGGEVPENAAPYVLEAGEGIRLVASDQLFTLLTTQANTNGQFIAVMTEGPKGNAIIQHFHERHTEMFFALDGQMTLWANGQEISFHPGDFLHIPPNTIHSYRLDSPYTKFLGFLTPGLFEPFFRTIGDPYEPHIFPAIPGPFHFDRLMQGVQSGQLDLKVVGPPPDGSGGPGPASH